MTFSFRAYVDESGDEGFVFLPNEQGSSRWLVLSALVLRISNDAKVVDVAQEVRRRLNKPPKYPLHFRDLKHEQRVPYARLIGEMPARTVSVLIHKPSITEPEIFQQEAFSLYRYATRLLMERVSWLCRDSVKANEGDGRVELIFSNRSAMSYESLRGYLQKLRNKGSGNDIRIDWNVINPEAVKAVNHDQLAGLQLADAVATSLYKAVNLNPYGETESRYLELISPTFYRHHREINGYGIKFWCADKAVIARVLALAEAGKT